jgi:hypothetical protein
VARKRHIIVIDWDGTLVENKWPGMGDWLPGAIEAVRRFQQEGYHVMVFSARLSPLYLDGSERAPGDVRVSVDQVRRKLDAAGLSSVGIWTKPGKPPLSVLIDDKAERYHGTAGAWKRLTEKVLVRLKAEEPFYPEGEWDWEGG